MARKQRVVLAYSREVDGKKHKEGATVETDWQTARRLINDGVAREAEPEQKASK